MYVYNMNGKYIFHLVEVVCNQNDLEVFVWIVRFDYHSELICKLL